MIDTAEDPSLIEIDFDGLYQGIEENDALHFDAALVQAVSSVDDKEAYGALMRTFERVREKGDLALLGQMAMTLAATACLHDHLQEFSSQITESFVKQELNDHDDHTSHIEEEYEEDSEWPFKKRKKSKNVKARTIFSLFFKTA